RAALDSAVALVLGRSERVDLWSRLTLLLMSNPQREIEHGAKGVFERCVALDLAANVTDDAAKPRTQKLQFPPRAFELVCMRVAPHHDGGALGQAQIALAQLNALALGQLHQLLDRAMGKPGVGRMRDRLLLHSSIYRDSFEIFGVDRPGAVGHREALLQQRGDLFLTQPLAPARERRAIKWQLVLEHHFPTEVLEIRVLHPSLAQRLVGEVVHMLENEQPGYQPRRQRRLARSHPTHRAEASRQKVPIDLPRQPHQRMAKGDERPERRAKQVVLAIVARLAHRSPPTANLAVEGITDRPNQESQTARKPTRIPGFLAKSIICSGQIIAIDQSLPNSSRTTKSPFSETLIGASLEE